MTILSHLQKTSTAQNRISVWAYCDFTFLITKLEAVDSSDDQSKGFLGASLFNGIGKCDVMRCECYQRLGCPPSLRISTFLRETAVPLMGSSRDWKRWVGIYTIVSSEVITQQQTFLVLLWSLFP